MPTLNNKFARAKSSLIDLRDDFKRRAEGLERAFPDESRKLFEQAFDLDQMVEDLDNTVQNNCNLGDRFEIFNK